ncbi:MAG: hypothetical protein U0231_09945 [Nitrospiraceae bacterium]
MLDNEVYGNTGGQESGMTNRGAVLKMAPLGKNGKDGYGADGRRCRLRLRGDGGAQQIPRRVESVIKKAVLIAREVGSTYIQAYTSCNIEYVIPTDKVMEDASRWKKRSLPVHRIHQ